MRLSEMCGVMRDNMIIEGLSPITTAHYVRVIRLMIAHIGDLEMAEFTRRQAESYLAHHRQTTSNGMLYADVSAIRKLVGLAVREGELQTDWSRSLKLPAAKRKLPAAMPVEQAIRIINEWPIPATRGGWSAKMLRFNQVRNRAMMAVALLGGARAKEVIGLDLADLDFARDIMILKNTKGGKSRLIPLHPELKRQLEIYIEMRLETVTEPIKELLALFVTYYRGRWKRMKPNSYSTIFKKHVRLLGLPDERAHNMRHTFATTLLENKADLLTIKELMGHERIETTMVYLKVSQGLKREAVNSLPIKLVPPRE